MFSSHCLFSTRFSIGFRNVGICFCSLIACLMGGWDLLHEIRIQAHDLTRLTFLYIIEQGKDFG